MLICWTLARSHFSFHFDCSVFFMAEFGFRRALASLYSLFFVLLAQLSLDGRLRLALLAAVDDYLTWVFVAVPFFLVLSLHTLLLVWCGSIFVFVVGTKLMADDLETQLSQEWPQGLLRKVGLVPRVLGPAAVFVDNNDSAGLPVDHDSEVASCTSADDLTDVTTSTVVRLAETGTQTEEPSVSPRLVGYDDNVERNSEPVLAMVHWFVFGTKQRVLAVLVPYGFVCNPKVLQQHFGQVLKLGTPFDAKGFCFNHRLLAHPSVEVVVDQAFYRVGFIRAESLFGGEALIVSNTFLLSVCQGQQLQVGELGAELNKFFAPAYGAVSFPTLDYDESFPLESEMFSLAATRARCWAFGGVEAVAIVTYRRGPVIKGSVFNDRMPVPRCFELMDPVSSWLGAFPHSLQSHVSSHKVEGGFIGTFKRLGAFVATEFSYATADEAKWAITAALVYRVADLFGCRSARKASRCACEYGDGQPFDLVHPFAWQRMLAAKRFPMEEDHDRCLLPALVGELPMEGQPTTRCSLVFDLPASMKVVGVRSHGENFQDGWVPRVILPICRYLYAPLLAESAEDAVAGGTRAVLQLFANLVGCEHDLDVDFVMGLSLEQNLQRLLYPSIVRVEESNTRWPDTFRRRVSVGSLDLGLTQHDSGVFAVVAVSASSAHAADLQCFELIVSDQMLKYKIRPEPYTFDNSLFQCL